MIELENLSPPPTPLSPELRWVLRAAFASEHPARSDGLHGQLVWTHAKALGLAERIAGRISLEDLPPSAREPLQHSLLRSAATCMMYEQVAQQLAATAGRHGIPVAFLKGLALFILETAAAGARPFSDLDILVPERRARALFSSLCEEGFTPVPAQSTEQHLPPLRSRQGYLVEIHFGLRGLQQPNGRATTFDHLRGCDRLRAVDGFSGESYIPERGVLAAHLLVHGFQQHLLRPRTYPLLRMIADLIDLLADASEWKVLEREWSNAIAHAVSADSLQATRELCSRLATGGIPETTQTDGASRLLAHLLAGSLDDDYARSLGTRYLWERLRDARQTRELLSYLRRKVSRQDPFATESGDGRVSTSSVLTNVTAGLARQAAALLSRARLERRSPRAVDGPQKDAADLLESNPDEN